MKKRFIFAGIGITATIFLLWWIFCTPQLNSFDQTKPIDLEDSKKSSTVENNLSFLENLPVNSMYGEIAFIQDKKIEVHVNGLKTIEKYFIKTNDETKIFRNVQKNQEQYDKEMQIFMKKLNIDFSNKKQNYDLGNFPSFYIKHPAVFSDLHSGQTIEIIFDGMITYDKLIEAKELIL